MAKLLVIGSPSLDKILIDGKIYESVGGAGLYVAMAARRSGVEVSLFGLRPEKIPDALKSFSESLESWMGPKIPQEALPQFVIEYKGGKTEYLSSSVASEVGIDPLTLPMDLSVYDGVHITIMGDSTTQMVFEQVCRERGAKMISLGTCLNNIESKKANSRELVKTADYFFMNEAEAIALFGSLDEITVRPHQVFYVTRAEKGALAFLGDHQAKIPGIAVPVVDPTGAGESFCGGTLASILKGVHPVMSGMLGAALAAEKVTAIGARALLGNKPPPIIGLDPRVRINQEQVKIVSGIVKHFRAAAPFNFVSDDLPPVGDLHTLDYFFATTLQQFSFWEEEEGRYKKPLIATLDDRRLKGSSYLFYAFTRHLAQDPESLTPDRQAAMTKDEMADIFRADDGTVQMPALRLHLAKAHHYGQDMLELRLTPQKIIEQVNRSKTPLMALLRMLDHIGGYKEDPIRKKSNLLALILNQRPENFMNFGENEAVSPVVDYHCMRSVLRIGLVDVVDDSLRQKLANRQVVSPDEEWAVRYAAYEILQQVEALSGKPIGAVDWFFFNYMRSQCPEMTDPVCEECALDRVCAKRKDLFQPVLRTSFY